MKIVTGNKKHHGIEMNFPIVGVKKIDENGVVDIEHDEIAMKLAEGPDWDIHDEAEEEPEEVAEAPKNKSVKAAKPAPAPEPEDEDEEEYEDGEEDDTEEDGQDASKEGDDDEEEEIDLSTLSFKELKETAKEADIKGWEKHKTKQALLEFLLKEMNG